MVVGYDACVFFVIRVGWFLVWVVKVGLPLDFWGSVGLI